MPEIKLVITDLDNTIYNWVDYYAASFRAMLDELVRTTGIEESRLKASFKRVHQRHRTSEYAFAIEELDVLADRDRGLSVSERIAKYQRAIHAFRRKRKETLKVYAGVVEALGNLRKSGRKIVAHTDAMMFYAVYRLQIQLGIAELFDGLFAPRDHGLPPGVVDTDVRYHEDPSRYRCVVPVHRELDPSVMKPDPRVLKSILSEFGVSAEEAVYVGDSQHKDVWMAQVCGVHDVLAKYGRGYDPDNWRLLVEITHWTDEDVARETKLASLEIKPTHTIDAFPEIVRVVRDIEGGQV